ncbi:nuclear transport factor 2 family protein [Gramella sp. MT6]|uniref:nuclear transport factor 2 family protein n=1 Tax=Gramella sp. MT6 TaxID=2705471 RepID=UPI001C60341D|nr:nuclear transport factor 2 family protein [Gramella sp. MT6]QYA25861.1 nuclear transport factor 2 family protein [Gramella sp. MT6]
MKKALLSLICIFSLQLLFAQVSHDSKLYKDLKARDSLLFDLGFNQCKINAYENFISEDLEFYHDQGGLTTNKEDFLNAVRNNICGNQEKKPIRKLIPGSLKVFPLYENGELYGAIQQGVHDFYINEPNKELYKTSSAKFTHVWILLNNEWILKRVLSYDHKNPE